MAITADTVKASTILEKGELRRVHIFMKGGGEQLSGLISAEDATELDTRLTGKAKGSPWPIMKTVVYAIDGGEADLYIDVDSIASAIIEKPDVEGELNKIISDIERQEQQEKEMAAAQNRIRATSGVVAAAAANMGQSNGGVIDKRRFRD